MDGGRSPGSGLGSRWRRAEGGGRLVARERVRTTIAVAASGALVLTVLAWLVDGDRDGDRVDDAVESAIDTVLPMGRGLSRALGEFVADLGSPVSTTLFMVAAALFAHLRCGPRALALVLVGPPVAMILQSTVLKPIIGRTRGDELAFPSGHTTSVTSIAVAMAVIVLSIPLAPRLRRWVLAALVVVPFAVAVCLVGRQYHYPTDTVGAVGLALAVVLSVAVIIDAMADSLAEEPRAIGPAGPDGPPPAPGVRVGPGAPTARIDRPVGPPRGVPAGVLPPPGRPPMPVGPPPDNATPTERLPSLASVAPAAVPSEEPGPVLPETAETAQPEPAEPEASGGSSPAPEGEPAAPPLVDDEVPAAADAAADPSPVTEPTADEPQLEAVAVEAEPGAVEAEPTVAEVEPIAAEVEPDAVEAEPTVAEVEPTAAEVEPDAVDAEPTVAEPAEAASVTPGPSEPEPDAAVPDGAADGAEDADADRAEEPRVEPSAPPGPARNGVRPPRRTRPDRQRSLTLRRPAGQRRGT